MNIVFLCGSLEAGRDGVGDYIRRLGVELIRQGHTAAGVALNDHYINNVFSGTQISEGIELPILRVPSVWSAKKRFTQVKDWVNNFNPDWLSLQFVPFSFHSKGLPIGLSRLLTNLGKGRYWHIMFHELWLGIETESSFKHLLWGLFQRRLIKSLVSEVKPNIVHTQTSIYQAQLCKIGINNSYLPLFSNIPKITIKSSIGEERVKKNEGISFVIFGFISSGGPVHKFVNEVALYVKQKNVKVQFTFIGRCGHEQENWVSACKNENVPVEVLGEQTVEQISKVLDNACFGISTTPIALTGKSGSIAAMREHGLPIICVSKPWQAREVKELVPLSGVYEYKNGNFKYLIEKKTTYVNCYNVSEVSRLLIESFAIK